MTEIHSNDVVRNFEKCREEQFAKLRADLGISLSDACLSHCAAHFANQRREPRVGELRLWDRLSALPAPPAAVCFTRLDTNDAAMAETFADMMNKRRELRPTDASPVSAGEALSLAGAALARGGKRPALQGTPMWLSDAGTQRAGEGRLIGAGGSSAVLRLLGKDAIAGPAETGDVFLLIRRGTLTPRAFRKAVRELLDREAFARELRGAVPISEGGILPLLLSVASGLYIDLSRMGFGRETSIEMLAGEFAGDWMVILPKDRSEKVLGMIAETGMRGAVFAAITAGAETVVVTYEKQRLTTETAFLRGFFRMPAAAVVLKDETEADPVLRGSVTRASCRYLANREPPRATVTAGDATVATAATSPASAPFRSTLTAALSAVLTLATAGGDYTEARLAIDLATPESRSDCGETLAAILGVYRAEAELGIPAAAQRIRPTAAGHVTATVFAVSKRLSAPPCRFARAGSSLFLVSVPMKENGIPDFAAFRSMLGAVRSLAQSKTLLSAHVLANETVTDALRSMRTDALSARLTDAEAACGGKIPLALLIESDAELPFARIATVAEVAASPEAAPAEPFRFPRGNGLVFRSEPEIAILAAAEDPDAQILAESFSDLGAAVTLCSGAETGRFSRAMLTANAAFVCAGAKWPRDEQTALARSLLERNGGVLVSLGNEDAIPAEIAHCFFPNGISLPI